MSTTDLSDESRWPSSQAGPAELRIGLIDDASSIYDENDLVDRTLQNGFPFLRFPAPLEHRFSYDAADARLRLILRSGIGVSLLYCLTLITDWFMVPDQLSWAMLLRVGVFMPICLLGTVALHWVPWPQLREWAVGAAGVLACVIHLLVIVPSHSEWAPAYLVVVAVVVAYVNTVQRMRFWPALGMCTVALLGHTFALATMPGQRMELAAPTSLLLISTIVFTLYCNYTLERDERMAYLLTLRQRALRAKLKRSNERLSRYARLDALTQLPNRRYFDEFLAQVWRHAEPARAPLSLLLFDVDHFKAYNDRYGHQAGDACLVAVGQALGSCLRRPGDLVARWGGEEFAAVLSDTPLATAQQVAERMRQAVESRGLAHAASGSSNVVTVSVGIASVQAASGTALADLIGSADAALYQAKARGRNRSWTATLLDESSRSQAANS